MVMENWRIRNKGAYILFAGFIILYSVLCADAVRTAFSGKSNSQIKIVPIHAPVTGESADQNKPRGLDSAELLALRRLFIYKEFLDSLQKTDSTKYDSILVKRPGLFDSIRLLETVLIKNESHGK